MHITPIDMDILVTSVLTLEINDSFMDFGLNYDLSTRIMLWYTPHGGTGFGG